jgi:hypothetical protein
VYVIYLIPYLLHICQPLNLSCFLVFKSKYRQRVAELAKYDNSHRIKKISFLRLYYTARQDGLALLTIKSGFCAAGLIPFNPDKVINFYPVLKNQPSARKRSATLLSAVKETFRTPANQIDLYQQI